ALMETRKLCLAFAASSLAFTVVLLNPVSANTNNDGKGHWTEWTEMSECSATCGSGTSRASRTYIPGPNDKVGKEPFMAYRTFTCTNSALPQCPRNGMWTGWSSWSDCTKACGGGERKRKRSCYGMSEGGKDCEGENFDEEKCSKEPCPRLPPHFDMSKCSAEANFTCASGKMCIASAQKCDSTVQCHDGSDELKCPVKSGWGSVRYDLRDGAPTQSKAGLWLGLVMEGIVCFLLTTAVWHH
ncbi:hemicentin-1, partial [Elysia marginata]